MRFNSFTTKVKSVDKHQSITASKKYHPTLYADSCLLTRINNYVLTLLTLRSSKHARTQTNVWSYTVSSVQTRRVARG